MRSSKRKIAWKLKDKLKDSQTAVHRSTIWRRKLKDLHPLKHELDKKKDRERKRERRIASRLDSSREARMKRKKEKEDTAIRVRRYRERKKRKEEGPSQKNTAGTSMKNPKKSGNSRREYHRLYKQKQRAAMTRQKKSAEKIKDRKRKKAKSNIASNNRPQFSKQKRSVQHIGLNDSPSKYVSSVEYVIHNATPRKVKELNKIGISSSKKERLLQQAVTKGLKETFDKIGKKQSKGARTTRNVLHQIHQRILQKYKLKTYASKQLGITSHGRNNDANKLFQIPAKQPSRYLPPNVLNDIKTAFTTSSTERPEKRFRGKRLMKTSLRGAFRHYKQRNLNQVCWTTFRKHRPTNIKKLSKSHLFVCQCIYCQNIQFKLSAINNKIAMHKNQIQCSNKEKIADVYQLASAMMCPKEESCQFHKAKCINNTCLFCKDKAQTIKQHYTTLSEVSGSITWRRWERRETTRVNKLKEHISTIRRVLAVKTGKPVEIIDELVKDAVSPLPGTTICQHLLIADWQCGQYIRLKKMLMMAQCSWFLILGRMLLQNFKMKLKVPIMQKIKLQSTLSFVTTRKMHCLLEKH